MLDERSAEPHEAEPSAERAAADVYGAWDCVPGLPHVEEDAEQGAGSLDDRAETRLRHLRAASFAWDPGF